MNNKLRKLSAAALMFVLAAGCRGMEDRLVVENQTGIPITIKWVAIGQGEHEEGPRTLNYREQLNLGSDVAYLKFSIGGAYHLWKLDKIKEIQRASASGMVTIQATDLVPTDDLEIPVRTLERAGGARTKAKAQQEVSGMALLNWFPRIRSKLISWYGEQELARKNIAEVEQLIDKGKREEMILAQDFFNLGENYTQADVKRAAEQLERRLNEFQTQNEAVNAARLHVMEAKAEALRVAPK